jgi:hypothetical protein
MISLKELNPNSITLTPEQEANLIVLHTAMNKIRTAYGRPMGRPMIVNSGVRSVDDQIRIYTAMGRTPALGSKHLVGAACDIRDKDGKLWEWCMQNLELLEECGLYLEDKSYTPSWVHFQCEPPKSGRRIFKPW